MIWFKYETHDYMDAEPYIGFRLFEDENQAKAWEKHMQENYSGGTTRLVGPAKKQEVLDFIIEADIDPNPELAANIDNDSYYVENL